MTITLRPLPNVDWIRDDIAFGTSEVSFQPEADNYPGPLALVSADLNCTPLECRAIDRHTVVIGQAGRERKAGWSLPREYGRLCLKFLGASEPVEPRKARLATTPAPPLQYGLQSPSYPRRKATQ